MAAREENTVTYYYQNLEKKNMTEFWYKGYAFQQNATSNHNVFGGQMTNDINNDSKTLDLEGKVSMIVGLAG